MVFMILCFRCSIRLLLCRIAVDVSELVPERHWVGGHEHAYQDSTVVRDQAAMPGTISVNIPKARNNL